jgi:ribonuclease P protein component
MIMLKNETHRTFPKSERLSSQKIIDSLFTQGQSLSHRPFIIRFIPLPDQTIGHHQVLISVSKRNFRKAVDRNKIKRLLREAYRLNKHIISSLNNKHAIAYIYTFKEILPFDQIESKLIQSLLRLKEVISVADEK